jgi:CPA1 family monovalent cation:H+ antiporter
LFGLWGDPSGENAADMQHLLNVEPRLEARRAERDELYRLRRSGGIDDTVHQQLLREIDLLETGLTRAPLH